MGDCNVTGPTAATWKSLNLSKLNNTDQNTRERFGPLNKASVPAGGSGAVAAAENRRQRCYKDDDSEEFEEASHMLSIDDFAPNFLSQKPLSQQKTGARQPSS